MNRYEVQEAVRKLHFQGVKPTPRAVYREVNGRNAPTGLSGMELIHGGMGRVRVDAMAMLGWTKGKNGRWQPPEDWVGVNERSKRVPERARLEAALKDT